MFRMDVTDLENILAKISDITSPKERLGVTNPVQAGERLALTLRFLATGETFQSLSFQYRISLNVVSYIVKGCCKAIVERMTSNFIKVPSTEAEWLDIFKRFEERRNFPAIWEQLTPNMSEFKSQKMVAPFTIITNILIPLF